MGVQKGFFSCDNQSCIPPGHKFVRSEEGMRVLYVFNHTKTQIPNNGKRKNNYFTRENVRATTAET